VNDLITIEETAALARRSASTIRFWIKMGTECGPLFGHFGRRRMARRTDVESWIDSKLPAESGRE
jgi:hypothetical protein